MAFYETALLVANATANATSNVTGTVIQTPNTQVSIPVTKVSQHSASGIIIAHFLLAVVIVVLVILQGIYQRIFMFIEEEADKI